MSQKEKLLSLLTSLDLSPSLHYGNNGQAYIKISKKRRLTNGKVQYVDIQYTFNGDGNFVNLAADQYDHNLEKAFL